MKNKILKGFIGMILYIIFFFVMYSIAEFLDISQARLGG